MEYKTLEFKDSKKGQKEMEKAMNEYADKGWRVVGQGQRQGKFGVGKTVALGAVFLPLALAGRKRGKLTATLEREKP